MKLNRLEVLDKNEIEMIHSTTLELLETVGIRVESKEIRNLLKDNGAKVDESNKEHFVKFPRELIKKHLKSVPKAFSLYGPDGSFKVEVNTTSMNFATFGAAVNMYDPSKKKGIRKSTLNDAIDHIRVVNVNFIVTPCVNGLDIVINLMEWDAMEELPPKT